MSGFPSIIDITDDAGLYFTSGTTGLAKGVLLTHRNLEFACFVENRHHLQTYRDNFLCLPPLYHTGAKMHWFGNLMVGARGVILKGVTPLWILETISEFPRHQYDTNYGLTEATGPGCIHLGMENEHKVGAIGIPGFDWEAKVVDDQHRQEAPGQPERSKNLA